MIVNQLTHNKVFEAFRAIDYDNGAVNCFEPELTEVEVPPHFDQLVDEAEKELNKLTVEELETFVIGEATEVEELIARYGLRAAYKLLKGYFEGWQGEIVE